MLINIQVRALDLSGDLVFRHVERHDLTSHQHLGLLRTKFQPSLRSKDLQRFDPTKMGKEPPIPIIPERAKPSEEEEGEEKCKVKIKVSKGVTKTFHPEGFYVPYLT